MSQLVTKLIFPINLKMNARRRIKIQQRRGNQISNFRLKMVDLLLSFLLHCFYLEIASYYKVIVVVEPALAVELFISSINFFSDPQGRLLVRV